MAFELEYGKREYIGWVSATLPLHFSSASRWLCLYSVVNDDDVIVMGRNKQIRYTIFHNPNDRKIPAGKNVIYNETQRVLWDSLTHSLTSSL